MVAEDEVDGNGTELEATGLGLEGGVAASRSAPQAMAMVENHANVESVANAEERVTTLRACGTPMQSRWENSRFGSRADIADARLPHCSLRATACSTC